MKEYFIVSDIHSFYTQLKDALNNSGFDKKNKDHILIVCGDVFDRGPDAIKVYNFIRSIPKSRRILIKGNHEGLYLRLLKKELPKCYDFSNGTVDTFCQISGIPESQLGYEYHSDIMGDFETWAPDAKETWSMIVDRVKKHPITKWLKSKEWVNYYELDNFILVHSFIPYNGAIEYNNAEYRSDWRDADDKAWYNAAWGCPYKEYLRGLFSTEEKQGKRLVCGHWHTDDFWRFLSHDLEHKTEIYYSKGIIAIDGGVQRKINIDEDTLEVSFVYVHPQNVLVIKDGKCYDQHGNKLKLQKVIKKDAPVRIETVTIFK